MASSSDVLVSQIEIVFQISHSSFQRPLQHKVSALQRERPRPVRSLLFRGVGTTEQVSQQAVNGAVTAGQSHT